MSFLRASTGTSVISFKWRPGCCQRAKCIYRPLLGASQLGLMTSGRVTLKNNGSE
ncbi:hypothetical protein MPTK1_6g08410 [Marchantia polymorpha subsp. ruderalis]|uniref:Uncharacterized protein n=2 Tax=Marchantia polymorpha TaxID=3197 RepID=A0AAF6BPW3_MARPO|nr:hypothetical protein MARPO_0060s0080 [Marchantia polymorpha]BBN14047.1 hypothetical protein Mp_6g08410 [Marchantia polymorpha subsp. ruderalis]|eukprot:PTQ36998.1 hypothetical protein MARPO_0060s0080 [Marchantia polymorpha]